MTATPPRSVAPDDCNPRTRGAIDLLLDAVNSTASPNGRTERWATAPELLGWFADKTTNTDHVAATAADAAHARELRDALVSVFRTHCGCETSPVENAEAFLQDAAQRFPISPLVTAEGVTFVAAQTGMSGLFGSVMAAAAEVASGRLWHRLKICKNPTCHAGFYDKTRNSSGQFCSAACKSQVTMRAYRERLKTA